MDAVKTASRRETQEMLMGNFKMHGIERSKVCILIMILIIWNI